MLKKNLEDLKIAQGGSLPEELLDVEGLAGALKVKKSQVYSFTRQGKIPAYKVGKYYRFKLSEVLARFKTK